MRKWGARRGKLPTLNYLVALEAADRLGSFRAAADEMNLTQGAVAQQIRALEKELDVPLFERLPRGLTSTVKSAEYTERIRLALEIIEEATKTVSQQAATSGNQLMLSTTPAFASRWLIPRLPHLASAYPDVSIMIDASDALRPLTGNSSVDMAIRWGKPPFSDGQALFLASGKAVAVCSPNLLEGRRLKRPEQLTEVPLISDTHNNWKRWFNAYGIPTAIFSGPVFSQTLLALEAAEKGLGVALVPSLLAEPSLETGLLVHALGSQYSLDTDAGFYVLTATTYADDSTLGKVVSWLQEQMTPQE